MMQLILELYEETVRRPGTQVAKMRYKKEGLGLGGARAATAEADEEGTEEA